MTKFVISLELAAILLCISATATYAENYLIDATLTRISGKPHSSAEVIGKRRVNIPVDGLDTVETLRQRMPKELVTSKDGAYRVSLTMEERNRFNVMLTDVHVGQKASVAVIYASSGPRIIPTTVSMNPTEDVTIEAKISITHQDNRSE